MKLEIFYDGERAIPLATDMNTSIMEEHWCRYRFAQNYVEGIVLDSACGSGYGSELISHQADTVIGVDISEVAIQYTNTTYKQSNISFLASDVTHLPFVASFFNFIVSFETIEHLANGRSFLLEVVRVLKPNGVLILSTPLGGPCGNPFHFSFYQRLLFSWLLLAFFRSVEVRYQRGNEIFDKPKSWWFAISFPDEYIIATCKSPYKKHPPFIVNLRFRLYQLMNATFNELITILRFFLKILRTKFD